MRGIIRHLALLSAVLSGGCEPARHCDDGLVYARGRCNVCPANSTFVNGSCVCKTEGYVFSETSVLCEPGEGVIPSANDDAGTSDAAGTSDVSDLCTSFCEFSKTCVADNAAAASILGAQLQRLGINGSDVSVCISMCEEATFSATAVASLSCVAARRTSTTCAERDDLPGAQQALAIYNACCAGAASEGACALTCTGLGSSAVGPLLTFCMQ